MLAPVNDFPSDFAVGGGIPLIESGHMS